MLRPLFHYLCTQKKEVLARKKRMIKNLLIEKIVSGGFGLARQNGKIVFVENALPGDELHAIVRKKRKDYLQAYPSEWLKSSPHRGVAFCEHFEHCGGCRWQHVAYDQQLKYKEAIVHESFERVGKTDIPDFRAIIGAQNNRQYRNKMEYTFSDRRWLNKADFIAGKPASEMRGLGFHVPRAYDKVLQIKNCHLQADTANRIRNAIYDFAIAHDYSFYNLRKKDGYLRNLILRNNRQGDWMVILSFAYDDEASRNALLSFIADTFPEILSLQWLINSKHNDVIYDLPVHVFKGSDHIEEKLGKYTFIIGAKSFFQTNPQQAEILYQLAKEYAQLEKQDILYDLYSGTGSIGIFMSNACHKVVGIESIAEAVQNAQKNAAINQVKNTSFYCGDMKDAFDEAWIKSHGSPDVVISDPPRAGMHPKVVQRLNESGAKRIIYISCNPVTQARDIRMMEKYYRLKSLQPVDMFPHTYHVETVALLEKI